MKRSTVMEPTHFFLFLSLLPVIICAATSTTLNTYIVHVLPQAEGNVAASNSNGLEEYYKSFLPSTRAMSVEGQDASPLLHSYEKVFSGFAAMLTAEEVEEMKNTKEGFVQAQMDRVVQLHTTHTPDFLGLRLGSGGVWNSTNLGEGVVIGVIDTGFTPNHPSFGDEGMPPPPERWKGSCQVKAHCNNKVIGAKSFVGVSSNKTSFPPVDDVGHGTHTASTAAGAFVGNANELGNANGTASGMAPRAHLSIYQVCYNDGCKISDVVAGIDAAIQDGVDILSISLGATSFIPYYEDVMAIAALSAVENGVFVSFSAGNNGPLPGSLTNEAPWMLTVGASTMDREIRSTVHLGNGQDIIGQSLNQDKRLSMSTPVKLFYPKKVDGHCSGLSSDEVKGKILLCTDNVAGLYFPSAAGMISMNLNFQAYTTLPYPYYSAMRTTYVSYADGRKIMDYINSSGSNATALISLQGTVYGVSPSPTVAYFSARGPSRANQLVIKPDIIGPGVDVLAAWIPEDSSGSPAFHMDYGTSMAAPHLAGVAALLKKAHPEWSPSAIKSAILTTSNYTGNDKTPIKNENHLPASFTAMGAGHVNPSIATDPGLVYETNTSDYLPFLCGLGYKDDQLSIVARRRVRCSEVGSISQSNLNYPSIAVSLPIGTSTPISVKRTVKNVGEAKSSYKVEIDEVDIATVVVEPAILNFSAVNEKQSFEVTFTLKREGNLTKDQEQGNLKWVSENRIIRTPFLIFTGNFSNQYIS